MTSSRSDRPGIADRLRGEILRRGVAEKDAAAQIGVSAGTLQNHLRGGHVRSDSLRKYNDWIAGRSSRRQVFRAPAASDDSDRHRNVLPTLPRPPAAPHLVVDVFAGCGGLSLGFDTLGRGAFFETVLAMDFEPAAVEVMNRNHPSGSGGGPVARVVDVTDFVNESEVLAFYLDHVAVRFADSVTGRRLAGLCGGLLTEFRKRVRDVDAAFRSDLAAIRRTEDYARSLQQLDQKALLQTSVVAFHERLKLPRTGRGKVTPPTMLWADGTATGSVRATPGVQPDPDLSHDAASEWDAEVDRLTERKAGMGKGQLSSSASRIASFVSMLRSEGFRPVRDAWCTWKAARTALRNAIFLDPLFGNAVRELYEQTYPVAVVLGGPPCQGFSRIGRGKIRSLRASMVHVHSDDEAGDARNRLYERYLLIISAFRPSVFKFENVQHFQSALEVDGKDFLATELLAEAISAVSDGAVSYEVASRTLDASKHGVPQRRQRFFMSGIRTDAYPDADPSQLARDCLDLVPQEEVPLLAAIGGLPEPRMVGGDRGGSGLSSEVTIIQSCPAEPATAAERLVAWLRQPAPEGCVRESGVDAHAARLPRSDDAELFSLFGPGKRWMDYRVDGSETVGLLRAVLQTLSNLDQGTLSRLNRSRPEGTAPLPGNDVLTALAEAADGSLAIRLILEQIGSSLDAEHHLATPGYLAKRDGHHGDWLARLDGQRPCKTIVAHVGKDTYGFVHPQASRTISAREAARIQTFPDWFSFGSASFTDAMKMIGNAVPPLLGSQIAAAVARTLSILSDRPTHRAASGLKLVGSD